MKKISTFIVTSVSPGPSQDSSVTALGHLQCQLSCLEFSMHFHAGKGARESPCSLQLLLILQLQLRVPSQGPILLISQTAPQPICWTPNQEPQQPKTQAASA